MVAAELRRCVRDPADEKELVRSRENLKGRMVLGLESTGARMGRLGGAVLAGHAGAVDRRGDRADRRRPDSRTSASWQASCSSPERLSVAGVGPAEQGFEEAMAPIAAAPGAGEEKAA